MSVLVDVRHAWKSVRRDPGHSLVVVGILAVGIAATVAVYSIVAAVVLRPLPFPDPDRLVQVRQTDPEEAFVFIGASGPSFRDLERESKTLSALTAYSGPGAVILGEGDAAERVQRSVVTARFFEVLGVRPVLGRLPAAPSDVESDTGSRLAVISESLWRTRFGADRSVIGRTLRLEGTPFQVVGVAPAGFRYPEDTEIWTAIPPDAAYFDVRFAHILGVIGRLAPGATPASAEAEANRILAAVPEYGYGARIRPLQEEMVGDLRTPLLLLLAGVVLVLLIAGANVGNLRLARSALRRRELAIRSALGAGRRRVAGQLVAESLILSVAAGVAGVVLAAWLLDALIALAPVDLPRADEVGLDAGVLAIGLLVTLATGILTGVAPAVRSARSSPERALRESDARGGGRAVRRLVGSLVVAEVALSVVLLLAAGLLIRSFLEVMAVDPGFRAEHVTTFEYSLPPYRYDGAAALRAYNAALLERVRALPMVASAATARNLPIANTTMTTPALVEGRVIPDPPRVQIASVSDDYFQAMGIRVVAGRSFEPTDRPDSPPVAIVDETFARLYFGGEDPVGRRARTYFGEPVMREIVGVVSATVHESLTTAPQPKFYYPAPQMPESAGRLVVRSDAPAAAVIAAVRAAARQVDPGAPFGDIATMRELIGRSTAGPRFYATTLGVFAALALLLAVSGFFAVLSQTVTARRREIGVRLAVGASPGEVLRLVVRQGVVLPAVGLALGLAGGLAASRLLAGLLYGIRPSDPAVLGGVVALLALVALLAAWLPARRAAATDPVGVLRTE